MFITFVSMAKAKNIIVKQSNQELKQLLTQQHTPIMRSRIFMLQQIRKSNVPLSKNELAELVGVNHNSIQKWRKLYEVAGSDGLLEQKRGASGAK